MADFFWFIDFRRTNCTGLFSLEEFSTDERGTNGCTYIGHRMCVRYRMLLVVRSTPSAFLLKSGDALGVVVLRNDIRFTLSTIEGGNRAIRTVLRSIKSECDRSDFWFISCLPYYLCYPNILPSALVLADHQKHRFFLAFSATILIIITMIDRIFEQDLPADWNARNEIAASIWQEAVKGATSTYLHAIIWDIVVPGDDDPVVKTHLFLAAIWNARKGFVLAREWTPRTSAEDFHVVGTFNVTKAGPVIDELRTLAEEELEKLYIIISIKNYVPSIISRERFREVNDKQGSPIERRDFDTVYREPKSRKRIPQCLFDAIPLDDDDQSDLDGELAIMTPAERDELRNYMDKVEEWKKGGGDGNVPPPVGKARIRWLGWQKGS